MAAEEVFVQTFSQGPSFQQVLIQHASESYKTNDECVYLYI
jgi:hypothetical protein